MSNKQNKTKPKKARKTVKDYEWTHPIEGYKPLRSNKAKYNGYGELIN